MKFEMPVHLSLTTFISIGLAIGLLIGIKAPDFKPTQTSLCQDTTYNLPTVDTPVLAWVNDEVLIAYVTPGTLSLDWREYVTGDILLDVECFKHLPEKNNE